MKIRQRDIPKEVEIAEGVFYKIKFKRGLLAKGYYGLCFYDTKEIWVSMGLDLEDMLSTLAHELTHAMVFEHDLKIDHKTIYNMENALAFLIHRNTVWIKWDD